MAVGFVLEVRAARSPGGPKAQRAGPAAQRAARAPHPFTAPFSEVRPRRAPHAPLMRRSRRGRRFCESRYSLSVQADEACGAHSNVSCGPPRSEASARATLRVAKAQPNPRPKALPNGKPHTRPSAAGKPPTVFPPKEQAQHRAHPSSPPRVGLTAAPLALRRFSAGRFLFARWRKSYSNANNAFE